MSNAEEGIESLSKSTVKSVPKSHKITSKSKSIKSTKTITPKTTISTKSIKSIKSTKTITPKTTMKSTKIITPKLTRKVTAKSIILDQLKRYQVSQLPISTIKERLSEIGRLPIKTILNKNDWIDYYMKILAEDREIINKMMDENKFDELDDLIRRCIIRLQMISDHAVETKNINLAIFAVERGAFPNELLALYGDENKFDELDDLIRRRIITLEEISAQAASTQNINLMIFALERGEDPNMLLFNYGNTSEEFANLFLAAGAAIDYTHLGKTVLMTAVEENNIQVTRFLLRKGAKIDIQDTYGRTALMFAASSYYMKDPDLFLELINRHWIRNLSHVLSFEEYLDLKSKHGETALSRIINRHIPECVREILFAGANPNLKIIHVISYLRQAIGNSNNEYREHFIQIIKYLLEYGANANEPGLLDLACQVNAPEIFYELLVYGAQLPDDPHYKNKDCQEIALSWVSIDEIDPDAIYDEDINQSILMKAIIDETHPHIIEQIILKSENINFQDVNGDTALLFAVYYGNIEIVRQLLLAGADPLIENNEGHSASSYAQELEDPDIYRIIWAYLHNEDLREIHPTVYYGPKSKAARTAETRGMFKQEEPLEFKLAYEMEIEENCKDLSLKTKDELLDLIESFGLNRDSYVDRSKEEICEALRKYAKALRGEYTYRAAEL